MELSVPIQIKAMDPFLRIRKKIGSKMNLKAMRQTAWPLLKMRQQPPKRRHPPRKGVKTPSPTTLPQQNAKGKCKSMSPYKTRSRSQVPLPEVASKKKRPVLSSLMNSKRQR